MLARIRAYAADSPFVISSVVVGNVQYPAEVADAVSRKLAATQDLQRKDTEIEIERKERTKREVQAQGIANAMQIIRGQLSAMYIQHEAIEAQKPMVNSPNHTVEPVLELGHEANDVAPDGPIKVRLVALAGRDDAAISQDDLGRQQVVAREAVLRRRPAVTATGGEPADASGGDAAAGRVQPVRLSRGVELAPQDPAARGRCAPPD